MTRPKFGLVIPVLNAAAHLPALLASLETQSIRPDRILAIDSSSDDDTARTLRAFGAEVLVIPRAEFDHGGTRQLGVVELDGSEVVVFLTQDVIFAGADSLERLVDTFTEPLVGAAYGRQLPRRGATAIEAHARMFSYPAESHVRSVADARRFGYRNVFLSNAFAAYRRSALMEVGGFPTKVILGEDSCAATRLLLAGWKIAYCADARVYHSHDYTFAQEFRRYFDIGVFHHRERWIRDNFGGASREGWSFVRSELAYVGRVRPAALPTAVARTFAKYAAYRLGRLEAWLPLSLKRRLGMNRAFWNGEAPRARDEVPPPPVEVTEAH